MSDERRGRREVMPGGRPTKYRKEMCEQVKQLLADGYSKEAAAGGLGISESRLYEWQNRYREFREAVKEGEKLSQKWWEDKGREACRDPENGLFNATVWVMQMKNRFGWKDARENKVSVESKPEPVSEIDAWIEAAVSGPEDSKNPKARTH